MWCQMFADVFGKPVEVTEVQEMGCLGAAMCAGIGAGLFSDTTDAISKCVRVKKSHMPNEVRHQLYEKAFQKWQKYYKIANTEIYV